MTRTILLIAITLVVLAHLVPANVASAQDYSDQDAIFISRNEALEALSKTDPLGTRRILDLLRSTIHEERQLARVSRHLCPASLGQELARLEHPTNVYITHIKPGEVDVVMSEIAAQNSPHRIRALDQGQVIAID